MWEKALGIEGLAAPPDLPERFEDLALGVEPSIAQVVRALAIERPRLVYIF
jgi:hypothetical protein